MPSEGDRFSFGYEQVVGTDVFGKFNAEYKKYWTVYVDSLDRKHIIATRMAYGQIVGDAPTFEKYFGGGIGSVRGFTYRGISPRGTYANGLPHDDPIGGDMMFFAGAEYSFPIVSEALRGVAFVDSGTVEKDFELTTYRISAGFGIRWVIPFMGPVPMAFDFGFPLVKDENDDTQIFSFSLGWTF
jgi:outer membrane protein insertion porin family